MRKKRRSASTSNAFHSSAAFLIIFGLLSFVANVFGLISINSRNIKNITVFALFEFAQCVALLIMSSLSALAEVFALILIYTYITMLKEKKLEEEQVDFYSIPVTIYDTPPAAVTRSTTSGPQRQTARMQSYQPSRPSTSGSHASQAVSSHSLPTYEEAVKMTRLERLELDSDDEAPNAIVPVAWFDAVSTPKDRRRTGSESNIEIPLNCLQLSEAYKESRLI